ncbi:UNVERIFIED_CONTAM: hypothetical protein GTU68_053013 [Idotea baltica]|nr:hypothetical protein [Idotea baltica]
MKGQFTSVALVTAVILAVWQAIVLITGTPHFILPSPLRVGTALIDNSELIAGNALVTAMEILVGMALGTIVGMATAIHLNTSAAARKYVLPVLVFTQAIPIFALAPVLTLWFGFGIAPKIIVVVLIVYFPVASAFYDGLSTTPRGFIDLAKVMGASCTRRLWRVQIPAAVPSLATGLKLAAVYAPIGAFIAEWVGASSGLGYLMFLANGRAKIDLMFAALVVLAVMTVTLRAAVNWFCRRILSRWAANLADEPDVPRLV